MAEIAPAAGVTAPPPSPRPICAGRVIWPASPQREVRECVLRRGHGGDHRDAAGYPWNDARWSD
jgi:hypothetical protein